MNLSIARKIVAKLGPELTGDSAPSWEDVYQGLTQIEDGDPRISAGNLERLQRAVDYIADHPRKHYIGGAGIHGCIYETCDVYDSISAAAESLGLIHDTDTGRHGSTWVTNQLRRYHYVELDMSIHGNEYAEISECNCSDPSSHSDSGDY